MNIITRLSFVKNQHEVGDIYTFFFRPNKQFQHKAGQHSVFIMPGLHRPHPFTLSSAPEEEFVAFSTHTNTGSPFKRQLLAMPLGAKMYMFGPILNFTFADNAQNHIFLAQGIGVTPFRSMLIHARLAQLPITTTLIHVDAKEHAFKHETKEAATHAFYPSHKGKFQELVGIQNTESMFYLSGSPRFVTTTKKLLLAKGVLPSRVKTDSFLAY